MGHPSSSGVFPGSVFLEGTCFPWGGVAKKTDTTRTLWGGGFNKKPNGKRFWTVFPMFLPSIPPPFPRRGRRGTGAIGRRQELVPKKETTSWMFYKGHSLIPCSPARIIPTINGCSSFFLFQILCMVLGRPFEYLCYASFPPFGLCFCFVWFPLGLPLVSLTSTAQKEVC